MTSHIRQIPNDVRRFTPKPFWVQVAAILAIGFIAVLVVSV